MYGSVTNMTHLTKYVCIEGPVHVTSEERAEIKKWDQILRKEGLGMSRGRNGGKVTYVGTLTDLAKIADESGAASCSKCFGYHTETGDCSYGS